MPEQHTRTLGSTGIEVSPVGLGLAALGRPGYINLGHARDLQGDYDVQAMQERTFGMLDEAYALGVRYVDAARSYGRAEEFLAAWLRGRGPSARDVSVGSKWGYTYTANWRVDAEKHEVKDHSATNLERQWPQTRELLGPWLRLYMVHSVTPDSPLLGDRAALGRLAALADAGVTVGLSVSGPQQAQALRAALEARVDGREVFRVVQATWNLLEPSAGAALTEAHARGWGVIVKEAVANGRLTSRGDAAAQPALRAACERHAAGPDAVAIAAALAQPFVHVVLSGAATPEHLRGNLRALSVHLDADELHELRALAEPPAGYWGKRAALAWT